MFLEFQKENLDHRKDNMLTFVGDSYGSVDLKGRYWTD